MRPAFYALRGGGWRDYVTILHLPYTAWHLSYVVVGASLAPRVAWDRLGWTLVAFFLAMGIGAHALDELAGRPLRTSIPSSVLAVFAFVSVGAACVIGAAVALSFSLWILVPVAAGAFLVPAYNLELFGGRLHNDLSFALAWGSFPVLTGYLASAGRLDVAPVLAAGWAGALSLAQRRLSSAARQLRREAVSVRGELELAGGRRVVLDASSLLAGPELALRLLAASVVLLALALALARA